MPFSTSFSSMAVGKKLIILILVFNLGTFSTAFKWKPLPFLSDDEKVDLALNLEYLEADYFLCGSTGKGLDYHHPGLAGPTAKPTVGCTKARLSPLVQDLMEQYGFQEVGHLRIIRKSVKDSSDRAFLNISRETFAEIVDAAFGTKLDPPFDVYASDVNYLLGANMLPGVGSTGYVQLLAELHYPKFIGLVARLLAIETAQEAGIRQWLFRKRNEIVKPYDFTLAEFTVKTADLQNGIGNPGEIRVEGVVVPKYLGAEGKVESNVLCADPYSLGYSRTADAILRLVYGTNCSCTPGGFYKKGASGRIARFYLDYFK